MKARILLAAPVLAAILRRRPVPRGRLQRRRAGIRRSGGGLELAPDAQAGVLRAFDPPDKPWMSGHRGVDLQAAADGAPVTAPESGTVSFVGVVVDRPVITIDHGNGLRSSFEPVESGLAAGAAVAKGDVDRHGAAGPLRPRCPACTGASGGARTTSIRWLS